MTIAGRYQASAAREARKEEERPNAGSFALSHRTLPHVGQPLFGSSREIVRLALFEVHGYYAQPSDKELDPPFLTPSQFRILGTYTLLSLSHRAMLTLLGGNIKCEVFGTTLLRLEAWKNDPIRAFILDELAVSIPSRRYGQVRGRAKELVLQTGEHKNWTATNWKDGDNPHSRDLEELPPGEIRTVGDLLPYLVTSLQKDVYEFQAHLILFSEDKELSQKALQQYQRRREAILADSEPPKQSRGKGKKLPPLPPSPTPPSSRPALSKQPAVKKEKQPVIQSYAPSYGQQAQEVSSSTGYLP